MMNSSTLKLFLSILFSSVITPQLFAQGSIEGIVIEQSEQPIEFSSITLHKASDSTMVSGVVSGANGKFELTDIPEGNYYVVVQFLGFEIKEVSNVLVGSKNTDIGKIILVPKQEVLNEVIVTAQKATVQQQLEKQVYTATNFQASQGGNAVEVLRNLPSLSVNAEGEISLRGSTSFIVLLDGKAIQGDPSVILGQLPANSIESIEILNTPSSKFDPDGKSGIINIVTKKGTTDGYYVMINAQGGLPSLRDYSNEEKPVRFGGDVTANIRHNKWNVSLSANYKRDDIAGYRDGEAETYVNGVFTTFPSTGERSYYSHSYGVRALAGYQINKTNSLETGFYAGKRSQFRKANIIYDQQRFLESTGEEINSLAYFNKNLRERKGDFVVTNLDYAHTFRNSSTIFISGLYEKTILGGPTQNTDVEPENNSQVYNDGSMEEHNPLDGVRIKTDYALPVGKKGKLEAGYQYRYLLHKGDFVYNQWDKSTDKWFVRDDLSNKIRLTRHIHAVYSQFSDELKKLSYSIGIRLEHFDRTLKDEGVENPYKLDRLNLFPSVNLQYKLPRDFMVKAGYSKRITHTTTNMMNPFPARRHSEVLEVGDPELLPEYIDAAEIGFVKDFKDNSTFINLYYRHTQNVINRVNTVYNDTILNRTFTNAGNATAFGLEGGIDLKITSWWSLFTGGNLYTYSIAGEVFDTSVDRNSVNYSVNGNTTFLIQPSLTLQLSVNYTSRTVTAQGVDSRFLIPSAVLKKVIAKGQGAISVQWQNIDMGLLETNEQRITTRGSDFYTSTNYIQEVDIIRVNVSYQLNKLAKKLKFTESEFGEKEF